MIAQLFYNGFKIAEITCPTKYFEKASSITLRRSLKYGFGVLGVSLLYFLTKTRHLQMETARQLVFMNKKIYPIIIVISAIFFFYPFSGFCSSFRLGMK